MPGQGDMLMYEIGFVFLLFLLYSVIGWACETVWCSVGSRKFVNRGFLNGPLCPIYGFGALAVLYLLRPFTENLFTVFLAGIVMTSFLEYVTGYLLERLFHLKLWDYSNRFCNINGRVCLRNSLLFGMMSVLLVWFIHPFLEGMLLKIPRTLLLFLVLALFTVFVIDIVVTVYTVLKLNGKLEAIHRALNELSEKTEAYRKQMELSIGEKMEQRQQSREEKEGLHRDCLLYTSRCV